MRKIVFVHQGKSGGASFVKSLHDVFGSEHMYRDLDQKKTWGKQRWIRFVEQRLEKHWRYRALSAYQAIYGHFSPEKYRKAFPNALYITFFRDPIQQLVSLYYYWQRSPRHENMNPDRKTLLEKELTLIEFAELMSKPKNINEYISLYRIDNFDFIGITEAYESSIELLSKMYLQGLGIKQVQKNINPDKPLGNKYE